MSRFHAVLFDFDGTLADSYSAITASVNHVLEAYGRPTLTEPQVRSLVGHGLLQLMATILPDVDPETSAEIYRAHHPSVLQTHTRLLPGVEDGIPALHRAGIGLGVCSNKPSRFTRQLVELLGLGPYFGAVLGPEDVIAAKPDPAMLLRAIEILGADRVQTLYVGDMLVDIETARNAAIPVWVVPTGSHVREQLESGGPDAIFPGIGEVVAAVLSGRSD